MALWLQPACVSDINSPFQHQYKKFGHQTRIEGVNLATAVPRCHRPCLPIWLTDCRHSHVIGEITEKSDKYALYWIVTDKVAIGLVNPWDWKAPSLVCGWMEMVDWWSGNRLRNDATWMSIHSETGDKLVIYLDLWERGAINLFLTSTMLHDSRSHPPPLGSRQDVQLGARQENPPTLLLFHL